jgi:four helix bundle protein
MQPNPKPDTEDTMALVVYDVALEMIAGIKPLVDRVARHDRALADQLRRSAQSVVLNIAEGSSSRGRNELARFCDAAGSARETRAALQVALAWGYTDGNLTRKADAQLDRIGGMLWGLTRQRA